jgi:hypothetical protein
MVVAPAAPVAVEATPDPILAMLEEVPAEPDLEPVEEPVAPEEIPPPAVVADTIPELKAKLAASIAPIEARTKPVCHHTVCVTSAGSDTKVCTECGEEIPIAVSTFDPPKQKRAPRQTRML